MLSDLLTCVLATRVAFEACCLSMACKSSEAPYAGMIAVYSAQLPAAALSLLSNRIWNGKYQARH